MPRSFRSFLHTSSSKRNSRTPMPARPLPKDVELPEHIQYLPSGFFKCVVCDGRGYYLQSLMGVKTHCQGRRHQMEAAKTKQTPPVEDIPKLKITSTGHYDRVFRAHSLRVPLSHGTSEMTFTLTNVSGDCTFRFLRWHGPYLNGELRFLQPPSESEMLVLQPGGSIKLTLQITPQVETTLIFKVYFRLEDLGRKVNPGKYASVVENCPVRISVVGEQKQEETPVEGADRAT